MNRTCSKLAALAVAGSLGATLVYAQSDPALGNVHLRAASAREEFNTKAASNPGEQVRAVAFFVHAMPPSEVRAKIAHWRDAKVRGFRHASQATAGGYIMKPGETVDQAIEAYRRDHAMFAAQRKERSERHALTENDPGLRKAIEKSAREASVEHADAEAFGGPRIVGVELEGEVGNLKALEESNAFIHFTELSQPGRPQPSPDGPGVTAGPDPLPAHPGKFLPQPQPR